MVGSSFRRSLSCGLLVTAVSFAASLSSMPSSEAFAQPIGKRPRAGLGKEIEGAVYQYTATRQAQGKTEKLEGKIRLDGKGIFELGMKRVAPEREKRVGDILTEKEETQLVFNNWDRLSGRAHIKKDKDKTQRNDLWVGYFDDSDKKRWKFELRKIED